MSCECSGGATGTIGICTTCGNPRPRTPNSPASPQHPSCNPSASLVEQMGSVVDDLRQLNTDFGLRPYRVFSMRVRWTGGDVGRGECVVVSEREFLPTPRFDDMSGVSSTLRSGGLAERGTTKLREISPRYTEDEVRGLLCCSLTLAPGVEGWIEVAMDSRDGSTQRRRFVVSGVPFRNAGRFEWTANLLRQDQDRSRSGETYPR